MKHKRLTFLFFTAVVTLTRRLAHSAPDAEQQAAATPFSGPIAHHSLLSAVSQGLLLALLIGFGAAILATIRKPPTHM